MDLNVLRSVVTLASFIGFVGIVMWAYSPRRKGDLEEVGAMLLKDGEGVDDAQKGEVTRSTGEQR